MDVQDAVDRAGALRRHPVRPQRGQRARSACSAATAAASALRAEPQRRSIPFQQKSIARSTSSARGTSRLVVPPVRQRLDAAREQRGVHLQRAARRDRALSGSAAISAAITADRLRLHALDHVADLGVGRVAEQRAPRVAVVLDEGQERVDAAAQPRLAVGARQRVGPQPARRSRRRAPPRATRAARAWTRSARRSAPWRPPPRRRSRPATRRGSRGRRRPPRRRRGAPRGAGRPAGGGGTGTVPGMDHD